MTSTVLWLALAGLCLAVSFLLSGMEAGVFALSRLRIRQRMRAGHADARVLHGYLENPEDFLWTILVGNTLANFTAVTLLLYLVHGWLGDHPARLVLVLVLVVFGLFAVADLLPKMLFRQYPNRLCLALAGPFRALHLLLSPLVDLSAWAANGLLRVTGGQRFTGRLFGTREELRQVMQETAQGLTSGERTAINRVLDLQAVSVAALTVPLADVVTVAAGTPLGEVLRVFRERGYARLPVTAGDGARQGRIIGLVSLKATLYRDDLDLARPVAAFVQPALYLEESVRLEVALRRLQRSGERMAIVLGRDGGERGIMTLQDILKFVFGEVTA